MEITQLDSGSDTQKEWDTFPTFEENQYTEEWLKSYHEPTPKGVHPSESSSSFKFCSSPTPLSKSCESVHP